MKRTIEDAAKTRVALLEAALIAFEEKGWRGATFDYISKRAGVTRGALNHHFSSKRVLLSEALEWGWSEYSRILFSDTAKKESHKNAPEALKQLLTYYVQYLRQDAKFRALASTTVLVAPQALADTGQKNNALDSWRQYIEMMVKDAEGSGELTARQIADTVLTLLQGFTVTAAIRPNDLPQPKDHNKVFTSVVRGLLTI